MEAVFQFMLQTENLVDNLQVSGFPTRFNSTQYNNLTKSYGATFSAEDFERRFRIKRVIYEWIKAAVIREDSYFEEGKDCTGAASATTDQK